MPSPSGSFFPGTGKGNPAVEPLREHHSGEGGWRPPLLIPSLLFGAKRLACLLPFANLLHKLEAPGKRKPQLRRFLHKTCLWASLLGIFLINDRCGRAWLIVVALDGIRKQTEQSTGSKSVSSVSMLSVSVPASGSCLEFLS